MKYVEISFYDDADIEHKENMESLRMRVEEKDFNSKYIKQTFFKLLGHLLRGLKLRKKLIS